MGNKVYRVVENHFPLFRVEDVGGGTVWRSVYQVKDMQDNIVCLCYHRHNAELAARLLNENT